MGSYLLILSIIFICIGHYFKMLRWKQFIEIYENPKDGILIKSLVFSYVINLYLPFRLGDIFRVIYAGKRMKNGVSFSLSTTIVDRYLDIIAVAFLFLLFFIFGTDNISIISSIKFYGIFGIGLLLLAFLTIKFSKYPKMLIINFCSIFNKNIEMRLLKFLWSFITTFKDLVTNISKSKLLFNTVVMWFFYSLSYYFFIESLLFFNIKIGLFDFFSAMFSQSNLSVSTIGISLMKVTSPMFTLFITIYFISPLIILYILSYFNNFTRNNFSKKNVKDDFLNILPQVKEKDMLHFLESYFSSTNTDILKNYLKINRSIYVLEDYSAGSNATTILCSSGNDIFYRKYAFGEDGNKLFEQVKWIDNQSENLKLTSIIKKVKGNDYCYYDMPYNVNSISLFKFIHSSPIEESWDLLQHALIDLENNLYSLTKKESNPENLKKYIQTKVANNIEKIEKAHDIRELNKYEYLIINGKKYINLKFFMKYLQYDNLYNIFKNDECSIIHGDMTIENIICKRENNSSDYYIIDPNTGNVHDSPNLDYAKLLQSLHGEYEFLMMTKNVTVTDNKIDYLHSKSLLYDELFNKYKDFLNNRFSFEKVKSIFYHEIIHWLRLMPYKIEKDSERSVLFYAGFIIVLNEVYEMYEKK